MRALTSPRAMVATAGIIALGCSSPEPEPASDPAAAPRPAAAPAAAPVATPAPWYGRTRALDLTGDARPDSVRLEAHGARPDSLDVVLTLVVEGVEKHRERWGSSYELALLDPAVRVGPQAGEILRARLDTVLAGLVVRRLDAPSVRLMAEDRAVLDSLQTRPTHLISFSYGYETTTRLVWDAPQERFVLLWRCC